MMSFLNFSFYSYDVNMLRNCYGIFAFVFYFLLIKAREVKPFTYNFFTQHSIKVHNCVVMFVLFFVFIMFEIHMELS